LSISDYLEKKTYATSYLECDLADQWEALQEFSDASKTYLDLKSRLFYLYNLDIPRYTHFDLKQLVSDRFRSGFPTLQALTEYHLRFNEISSHLLEFGLLSPCEQSLPYLQAFDTFLRPRIDLRLQIKYPDHHPSRPYSIDRLFDAARWILRDPSAFPTPPILSPVVSSTTQTPTIPDVTLSDVAKAVANVNSNPMTIDDSDLPPTTSLLSPSASNSTPLACFLSNCTSTEDDSTLLSTLNLPHSVQSRIDEIEEELYVLRAQPDPLISEPTPATSNFVYLTHIVNPATFVYRN
jgi:hypothetical protein